MIGFDSVPMFLILMSICWPVVIGLMLVGVLVRMMLLGSSVKVVEVWVMSVVMLWIIWLVWLFCIVLLLWCVVIVRLVTFRFVMIYGLSG